MSKKNAPLWILAIVLLLAAGLFGIPQVRERVFARVDEVLVQLRAALFPIKEEAFVPGGARLATITPAEKAVVTRGADLEASPTITVTLTHTPAVPQTPLPSATPTASPTPLPAAVSLKGVRYETQNGNWNYCGPTNLSMLLSFWGWKGTKLDTGKYLKPFEYDLNVMPYEMVNFIQDKTNYGAVLRLGGSLGVLKTLLANGFPVLVEKGVYFHETASGQVAWMGHYTTLTGYDDQKAQFITQDSFVQPDLMIAYDQLELEWRSFDFPFLVAYPKEREAQVLNLLSDYADENKAFQIALKRANEELVQKQGIDLYFAWFNRGTSLVKLQDFAGAAEAYDKAFAIYPQIPDDKHPWRMLWYQTGPYFAYYYSGRYQDVVDLATSTIDFINKRAKSLGLDKLPYVGPFIEESWYWRGLARLVIGENKNAVEDFKTALKYHAGFQPALDELKKLGVPTN